MVGNDVVKLSEAYDRDTGYALGGEGELKGAYKFKNGIYKFQVVDENNHVLSKEQIRYEIRSNGKRCVYDSL